MKKKPYKRKVFYVGQEIAAEVEKLAKKRKITESEIVRYALHQFFKGREESNTKNI